MALMLSWRVVFVSFMFLSFVSRDDAKGRATGDGGAVTAVLMCSRFRLYSHLAGPGCNFILSFQPIDWYLKAHQVALQELQITVRGQTVNRKSTVNTVKAKLALE
jgi:hypothetical protein